MFVYLSIYLLIIYPQHKRPLSVDEEAPSLSLTVDDATHLVLRWSPLVMSDVEQYIAPLLTNCFMSCSLSCSCYDVQADLLSSLYTPVLPCNICRSNAVAHFSPCSSVII